jgi:hypothetical protein
VYLEPITMAASSPSQVELRPIILESAKQAKRMRPLSTSPLLEVVITHPG